MMYLGCISLIVATRLAARLLETSNAYQWPDCMHTHDVRTLMHPSLQQALTARARESAAAAEDAFLSSDFLKDLKQKSEDNRDQCAACFRSPRDSSGHAWCWQF